VCSNSLLLLLYDETVLKKLFSKVSGLLLKIQSACPHKTTLHAKPFTGVCPRRYGSLINRTKVDQLVLTYHSPPVLGTVYRPDRQSECAGRLIIGALSLA
jgi:hypothetical protein